MTTDYGTGKHQGTQQIQQAFEVFASRKKVDDVRDRNDYEGDARLL